MYHNFFGDEFKGKGDRGPEFGYGNRGMFPYQYAEMEGFAANVYEKSDHYLIKAELPGVRKDDIELERKNNTIIITAVRRKLCEEEDEILCQERVIGKYQRSFTFDDIRHEKEIKASLERGILTIRVPRKEPEEDQGEKRRQIDIE